MRLSTLIDIDIPEHADTRTAGQETRARRSETYEVESRTR
jgi:hypothetical protein